MKVLTLKQRAQGIWHDAVALQYAFTYLIRDYTIIQAAPWLVLSAKIQPGLLAKQTEIVLQMDDAMAKMFWEGLKPLPSKAFGRSQEGKERTPDAAFIGVMFEDFALQLGEVWPPPVSTLGSSE